MPALSKSTKSTPERRCVVTREVAAQSELLRFVQGPDGTVAFDISGKAEGRGAYVSADFACLEKALKTKALARAFDGAQMPDNLPTHVVAALKQRILQNLGMAKKSNLLIIGADRVLEAMRDVALVIVAEDSAENTKARFAKTPGNNVYSLLNGDDLEVALGVANAKVVGIKPHGRRMLEELIIKFTKLNQKDSK